LALIAVVIGLQYQFSYRTGAQLNERLIPAKDLADDLVLAQASASGDLSDYVLTGRERSLTAHEISLQQADSLIRALEATLEGQPQLIAQLTGVRAAQQLWITNDAEPTLQAMANGNTREAARLTNRPRAWQSFDAMLASTNEFRETIELERRATESKVASFARSLGIWLLIMAAALIGVLGAAIVVMQRWVFTPLREIRRDMKKAAEEVNTHPIAHTGPPELAAVATDAEILRRSLVAEIDEARAARRGLAQDAPLVSEVRAAFTPSPLPHIPALTIAGTTSSAEGVIAGDWWDSLDIGDDRLAVVLGDTSGHGTSTAVTALRTRDLLRGALQSHLSPQAAVHLAMTALRDETNFVTAFIAEVDSRKRTLTYVNAGHQPAIKVTREKDVELCEGTGPLLSALGGQWHERTVAFNPGDVLLIYSDGLVEGHGPDGTDLDITDLSRIIRSMDAPVRQDAREVLERVISQVRERSARWQRDDMTAVTIGHAGMAI
jgi:serine phosphatase RsbU (regulator of sigma subunit)/CHASE3 domain sensor protein